MKFSFLGKNFILFFFIGFYLLLAPFIQVPEAGMYDSKRVLQLLLFLLIAVIIFVSLLQTNTSDRYLEISKKVLWFVFLLAGLGVLSSSLSYFHEYAFLEILLFGTLLCLSVLISVNTQYSHLQLGKFIYTTAILFTGIYLIYFIGNYIAAHLNPLVPMWPDRLSVAVRVGDTLHRGEDVLNFVHKRFFNHIQTWTLPLLVSIPIYFKKEKIYRYLTIGLLVGWWCLIFASGARGTIASFLLASIVLLILFRKRSFSYFKYAGIGITGGLVSYWLLFKIIVPVKSLPVARMSDSGRLEMWGKAFEMWMSNPLFGVGPMHYAAVREEPYFAHPHNFYLQFLAEWGTIAFVCFLFLLGLYLLFFKETFLTNGFKVISISTKNTAVYLGMIGSLLGGFLHAGVSGVLHTPMSQVWAVIIVAWFLSLYNRYDESVSVIMMPKKYLVIFYILLVTGLLYSTKPYLSKMDKEHLEYRSKFKDDGLYPRFWEQGLIYQRDNGGQETRINGIQSSPD